MADQTVNRGEIGWVPRPDPTILTTELVDKAINALEAKLQTRFNAMDKATELLSTNFTRVPTDMDRAITHLRELLEAKIDLIDDKIDAAVHRIDGSFIERDTRTEQTAAGVKIAVDAALQAAKEAVAEQNRSFALATGKSETATMKQIDALGLAIQTANKGLDDKIADMKDRLTRIEGMDLGSSRRADAQHYERVEGHSSSQNMIGIIGILAATIMSGIALFVALSHGNSTPPLVATVPASPPILQRQMDDTTQMHMPYSAINYGWQEPRRP